MANISNIDNRRKTSKNEIDYFGSNKTFQSMIFPSNHPTFPNQQPKRMKQVLIERNLWYERSIS